MPWRSWRVSCSGPPPARKTPPGCVRGEAPPSGVVPAPEKQFGGWKVTGSATAARGVPDAPQLKARQIYIVDKPGAAQSQIRVGWIGAARSTPDYHALQVLNTILGGSFTSR